MVTLKQVAEKAHVSMSTVSRVLNNDVKKPASQETAEKVRRIAKELGYVPNQNAINLIKGQSDARTKSIGLVYTSTRDTENNSFFSLLYFAIRDRLMYYGYNLRFSISIYEKPLEQVKQLIDSNPVDGLIIMGRFQKASLDYLLNTHERLVYVGVNKINAGFDEVLCNSYLIEKDLVDYLIKKGHRKIGFIGDGIINDGCKIVNEHRFQGFNDAMILNALKVEKKYIVKTSPYMDSAYKTVSSFLETKPELPTAFICTNDATAIGAIKAFREHGISVPKDVSIMGFDNIVAGEYIDPALSTVNIPKKELGSLAVDVMIKGLKENNNQTMISELPYQIIERESVKDIN